MACHDGAWRNWQTRVPQEHAGIARAGSSPAAPTKAKTYRERNHHGKTHPRLRGCAPCSRELKPIGSNVSGGLDRTVTLYDYQGDVLGSWSGRFDVSEDDNEVFFDDAEGKRVIIQGGVVVCEEN